MLLLDSEVRDRRILLVIRWAIFVLCVGLAAITGVLSEALPSCVILGIAAIIGSLSIQGVPLRPWQFLVESVLAGTAIGASAASFEPLSLYLLIPALAAGLSSGARIAFMTAGLGGFTILITNVDQVLHPGPHLIDVSQWVLLALGVGLLGAWIRKVRVESTSRTSEERESYVSAHRLLSDLRDVSRRLSGGLDLPSLAESLLQSTREQVPFDVGTVLTRSASGVFVPVARLGNGLVDDHDRVDDSLKTAWSTREIQLLFSGTGHLAFAPLVSGSQTVAILAVKRIHQPYVAEEFGSLSSDLADSALRIDTALLFDEVRSLATVEERRRLAREIHDGIAQEVASLGYVIDDLAATSADITTAEGLRQLRSELSGLVGEIRRSIFDLRSDITPTLSLGTALAEYVQAVGADTGMTVHLILDESRRRLRTEVEAELLRIAQEAVTNARKHAQASNLWVTCRIEPPSAFIRVEDDGVGLGPGRADSYGLQIMTERANRIGAVVSVAERWQGGTVAEVVIGSGGVNGRGGKHAQSASRR